MKKLTLEEWEREYIVGPVERFDEKYTMFSRPLWDDRVKPLLNWVLDKSKSKNKEGSSLRDQALRVASRTGTMMHLFENDRPNPSAIAREIGAIATPERVARNIMVSLPPPGEKWDVSDPLTLTRDIKNAAIYLGADIVGICKLDRRWIYSTSFDLGSGEYNPQEIPDAFQYAIVMGFGEDHEMLRYAPTYIADAETSLGYSRMAITNAYVSKFIKVLGYDAMSCSTNTIGITIPMAAQAGLGQLGRNGLLITPKFGPAVRISKVLTSLPLVPDTPIDFGVTELCSACEICADKCPGQAIMHGERTKEARNESNSPGVLKWPIDAEKCIGQWSRIRKPCTVCISVCPFNKPDNWFHSTVKWFVDHVRWADPFYVKMDKICGYGRPADPKGFWDRWEPQPARTSRVKIKH
ncbi:MAG: reductive dehalogenase [Deltaproteobacteria bacterium]|nr:reductive dehalogenase [Deltaproteobacteria bacterium]MBW2136236.1 reductive dehalogenase [Deltaproteobacteria bacterium]